MRKFLVNTVVKNARAQIDENDLSVLHHGGLVEFGTDGVFNVQIGSSNPFMHATLTLTVSKIGGGEFELVAIGYAKLNRHHDVEDAWDAEFGLNTCLVRMARSMVDQYIFYVHDALKALEEEARGLGEVREEKGELSIAQWLRLLEIDEILSANETFDGNPDATNSFPGLAPLIGSNEEE
jgi:hypothetical protein